MPICKCRYCKNQLNSREAYSVLENNQKKFYCSEEHYKLDLQQKAEATKIKQEYDDIFEVTKEIFGYEFGGYAILKKQIVELEKLSTREKILSFLEENKGWLKTVMNKDFANDFVRVKYYTAVLSSRLHDYKPKVEIQKPQVTVEQTIYEAPTHTNNKRRSLADLEDDF